MRFPHRCCHTLHDRQSSQFIFRPWFLRLLLPKRRGRKFLKSSSWTIQLARDSLRYHRQLCKLDQSWFPRRLRHRSCTDDPTNWLLVSYLPSSLGLAKLQILRRLFCSRVIQTYNLWSKAWVRSRSCRLHHRELLCRLSCLWCLIWLLNAHRSQMLERRLSSIPFKYYS